MELASVASAALAGAIAERVCERRIDLDKAAVKQVIYIVACIVAVCVDPFFLYIPFLSHAKTCLGMNTQLWKVAVGLRTVADFFTAQILFNRSIKSILLMCVNCLALAPIPQILFSQKFILKTSGGYVFGNLCLFSQYGTRLILIFRSCEELKIRLSVTTLVWFNALVYLFLYLFVSHVIGASWYYFSIKRQVSCWNHACKIDTGCIFHCDGTTTSTLNSTLVNEFCPINPQNATVFDYGIYLEALQCHIVEDKGLLKKFLRCFFWGLRNLSSFASNLQTSTNGGETFFAIIISSVALILLIYIIGNIQRYAELASARSERIVEKMKLIKPKIELLETIHHLGEVTRTSIEERIKKALKNNSDSFNFETLRDTDDTITESLLEDLRILETRRLKPRLDIQEKAGKWLSDNEIYQDYRDYILACLNYRLADDQDVNLKSVLSALSDDYEWIKEHLCFDAFKKVPGLENIDKKWFRKISRILKPVIYPKESYIFREGEPLDFIIFITNGIAWSYTTSSNAGGRVSGSSNSLEKGGFFGEELVQWRLDKRRELVLDKIRLSCIPISTANVKSHTKVEALVLMTKDLALCSDFPVDSSRSADSVTERVSSSQTKEGASVQREIEEV